MINVQVIATIQGRKLKACICVCTWTYLESVNESFKKRKVIGKQLLVITFICSDHDHTGHTVAHYDGMKKASYIMYVWTVWSTLNPKSHRTWKGSGPDLKQFFSVVDTTFQSRAPANASYKTLWTVYPNPPLVNIMSIMSLSQFVVFYFKKLTKFSMPLLLLGPC